MARYAFRILNVFAPSTFDGNPLCVFEDGRGLTDAQMFSLTRQFNLSETAFLFPPSPGESAVGVHARVRVFTPGHEMAFAGHPALGCAHVARTMNDAGPDTVLRFNAGDVPLSSSADDPDLWTFTPPQAGAPRSASPGVPDAALAAMLGLSAHDLASPPIWMDTGAEHLLVPVRDADALSRASLAVDRAGRWPVSRLGRQTAYVFAIRDDDGARMTVDARYFFIRDGALAEDPGTGSACANLGAWLSRVQHRANLAVDVIQGEKIGRLCHLTLHLDAEGGIRVGGRVIEIGCGQVEI